MERNGERSAKKDSEGGTRCKQYVRKKKNEN